MLKSWILKGAAATALVFMLAGGASAQQQDTAYARMDEDRVLVVNWENVGWVTAQACPEEDSADAACRLLYDGPAYNPAMQSAGVRHVSDETISSTWGVQVEWNDGQGGEAIRFEYVPIIEAGSERVYVPHI